MADRGTRIVGEPLVQADALTAPALNQMFRLPEAGGPTTRAAAVSELQRQRAVRRLGLLDTDDEERFDRITRTARDYFGVSSATISLITDNQQYLKSFVGPLHRYLDRSIALCNVTIRQEEPLIIPDTLLDPQFSASPLVIAAPFLRFYAGVPLRGPGGWFVGSFCVLDQNTRAFSQRDRQKLIALANEAEMELNN